MDMTSLVRILPPNAKLLIGDLSATVANFLESVTTDSPIGFVALDVDYYSSAKEALRIFDDSDPNKYLPIALVYLDDITFPTHCRFTGELLAIEEFNAEHPMRKIDAHRMLKFSRVFKNARWIEQIFLLHVFDHTVMRPRGAQRPNKTYPPIAAGDGGARRRVFARPWRRINKAARLLITSRH
jgi:hypothetical protein